MPIPTSRALATDLYELTMARSYRALGMKGRATFSAFSRKLPDKRSFLVAMGVEDAIDKVLALAFDESDGAFLARQGFGQPDVDATLGMRFTGDVWAVPEGRVVFPNEPLLEVDGPIVEAQYVETLVLNALHFPTTVASKAARCVAAAGGRTLVDFGLRRTPGIEAGLLVARACYLVGFAATSNVLAGKAFDIPLSGTVAHSFIEALPSEREAFEAWVRTAADPITLLVDTYDTLAGVRCAALVARGLLEKGRKVASLRLDSGDLAALSRAARAILDEAGFADIRLFASGGLDEYAVDELVRAGAPLDGFGVGTRIGTAADAPVLDMAYKIVAYDGLPCLKLSEGKATLVGPKQVWRRRDTRGQFVEDLIAARDEPSPGPDWEPLLERVVQGGARVGTPPSLREIRERHARETTSLPEALRSLEPAPYRVSISPTLASRQQAAVAHARAANHLA